MKNLAIGILSVALVVLAVLLIRQTQAPATAPSAGPAAVESVSAVEPASAAAPEAEPAPVAVADSEPAPKPKAPSTGASAMCRTLLDASVAGDFDAFRRECEAKGDSNMRMVATDPSTGETFKRASAAIAASCRDGYDLEFLGSLTQRGHDIYLWKLAPKTGGDQFVVRLTLKNKRLAGFFFQ